MQKTHALLADDMGLGKTAQAITAAKALNLTQVLIICPASVKYNWAKEIKKWQPQASTFIVEGRTAKIPTAQYTIINYDLIYSRNIFLQLIQRHFDLLICDEAHYLKNNRAKRTKCVYYPKGLKDRSDRVWLLTGTPILNRPVELFSHLKALAPERLGKKYTSYIEFCKRYCAAYEGKWGWDVSGASNTLELAGKLKGFMLRRLKKDVLKELPEKIYQTIEFNINKSLIKKERAGYEKEKNGVLGELATIRRESGLAKMPHVLSHIKDVLEDKEKLVVFAYHRDVIQGLMESLGEYSPVCITGDTSAPKRQDAVENFKRDKGCRVFLGQIEAAGVGIDGLQDVCDTVVFAEITWVPGQINQAIDRCHRIGQKNAVLIQFLIAQGSVDEDIIASVSRKEAIIKQIIRPPKKEDETMSMENELKRIADALEALVCAKAGEKAPEVPGPAPKKTKKKKAEPAPEPVPTAPEPVPTAEETPAGISSGPELMKYCNEKFMAMKDKAARTAKIKEVAAMFREQFNIQAIKELPAESVAEAKAAFDQILGD